MTSVTHHTCLGKTTCLSKGWDLSGTTPGVETSIMHHTCLGSSGKIPAPAWANHTPCTLGGGGTCHTQLCTREGHIPTSYRYTSGRITPTFMHAHMPSARTHTHTCPALAHIHAQRSHAQRHITIHNISPHQFCPPS